MTRSNGEMAARVREFDWSSTALGPFENWPVKWRNASELILDSGFPAALALGPELLYLYNDAFIPLAGPERHPSALGRPVKDVWREIWPYLDLRFQEVLATGRPTLETDVLMLLKRSGYLEETYMRLSFAALRDDGGAPSGIFCTATENTELVITKRQTDCLRRLATRCAAADSPEEACHIAAAVLDEGGRDVPFALLYLLNRERGGLEMAASAGLDSIPEGLSRVVPLDAVRDPWRLTAAVQRGEPSFIEEVAQLVRPVLRRPDPLPQRAITIPVLSGGPESPFALLVAGLNPMRPTEESRQFHQDTVAHLESAIRSARMKQLAEERARGLAALDRAKTVFFSNVSHELRTPLTLLIEPLRQVLEHARLEPEERQLLETAQQAVRRLHKLINSLLEFSRVEAGRADPHYQPTDLALLTTDLAGMFRSVFECANVALIVDCPATPEPAYVDPEMWAKIVHNLLSNALKFTLEGQVIVRLRTLDDQFDLEVMDTGCGIAEKDLPRIFQRFAMVRAPRARTVEGTGIGLSLAQELTKLHGGIIEVRSDPGAGARFTVRIPRGFAHLPQDRVNTGRTPPPLQTNAEPFLNEALGWLDGNADPRPSTVNAAPAAVGTGSPGTPETIVRDGSLRDAALRERVLVVDDNAPMRQYLSRLLKDRWHVETEADGAAALEHARAHPPDVVVADVMMPRMDGIELLRALRSEPPLADIPVLILSARAGEEASVEGLRAGANDYLVKPFSQRELVARIEVMLAQGRQRAAERLARTQAEQNLRAREEFFAALAHELRSPVSQLFSWLEVLQSERVTRSQVLRSLEVFELAAATLRRLSQDLYDVARARSRPLVAPRPFASIAPLIATVVEAFEPAASKKRITLYRMLKPESGPANVDPERLQQIVTNLLSNAIRFTPPGGRIDITCALLAENIELRVSDTGRGIPAEALPHVFERYWQGRRPADDDSGLGLGLSISRRLVELHGGEIEAVSEGEGLGATFVIQFPLIADRAEGHEVLEQVNAPARVRDSAIATEILAEQQVARDDSTAA
jgi:signal transduction histidine kinase